ncbi:MAG: FkbM family methyltransferase [Pseudomonadota bacterium]
MSKIVGSIQQSLSRSRFIAKMMIKLRDQCNSVIGLRCKSSIDQLENGEGWLAAQIGPRASLIVDVGANLGNWVLLFADHMAKGGRAILFEPNPDASRKLAEDGWRPQEMTIELHEKAVSDAEGVLDFYAEADAGETSSLVSRHSLKDAQKTQVAVTTLDREFAELGADQIDMLKIDAEGFDLHVLLGARQIIEDQKVAVIQFEYNAPWAHAGSTLSAAYQLLEGAGYKVFLLKSEGLFTLDPAATGEFFRYSNFVAFREDVAREILSKVTPQPIF